METQRTSIVPFKSCVTHTAQNKRKPLKQSGGRIIQGINIATGTIDIFSKLPLELILSSRSNTEAILGYENELPKKKPNAHRIHVSLLTIKINTS